MTNRNLRTLHPEIQPFDTGRLQVGDGHVLYFERVGDPNGAPALVLHGGPGGGLNPNLRRYFDPNAYCVTLFDQRGCGRSRPFADITANTTWRLVEDIEALRQRLGVRDWLVFGGSWGSTLALAYAQSHPEHVRALILRGIFTGHARELVWFYQSGAPALFPDAHEDFALFIPAEERHDLLRAYHKRIHSEDVEVARSAAIRWARWEAATCMLRPDPRHVRDAGDPDFARAIARIETHYFVNNCFFDSATDIFARLDRIRHIPATIIHGRYDAVTPLETAWRLAQAWPEASFHVAPTSGHSVSEPELVDLLLRATDRMRSV